MQLTVGLDFGTHQTKVCIESKEGAEQKYTFLTFKDCKGRKKYTLPSIIQIGDDRCLRYGFITDTAEGKILRYFKQATFTDSTIGMSRDDAIYYSIWYIAYILFDLEEIYGQNFSIQMGVPSDGTRFKKQKQLAVRILLSAYRLVEEVFKNNKDEFLRTSIEDLYMQTELLPYDEDMKLAYGLLTFPEAYACLMPLVKSAKISTGMSLMVDIGGGTTDISFFTIKEDHPQVYDFYSLSKGLNYLTNMEHINSESQDSNVYDENDICSSNRRKYNKDILKIYNSLINRLLGEFSKQSSLPKHRLFDALKNRPIIYSGGGSMFDSLRMSCGEFKDIIHISEKEWRTETVKDMRTIKAHNLCPILSTAYGLSISVADDEINCEPFRDIFSNLRDYDLDSANDGGEFNYTDDYDAWK